MKKLSYQWFGKLIAMAAVAALVAPFLQAQELPRPSPNASVYQKVGLTDVTITYSRPGVKGRQIWGGLVPYNKVWRTGANEATKITFSDEVKVNGQPLPAGTYAMATIPGESEWTIIFSKQTQLWGSFGYKPEEDALRVQAKPQAAEFMERMQFYFTDLQDNSALVALRWEKLLVPFMLEVDVHARAMANIEKAMAELKPDDFMTPYRCASYCLSANTNLEKGLEWINLATSRKETFFNMSAKAQILAKLGKTKEAIAAGEKSLALAKASEDQPNMSDLENMMAEWKKAM